MILHLSALLALLLAAAPADKHRAFIDLRLDTPPNTTALRFSLDGIQLAEFTDNHARVTPPIQMAATGWFAAGKHIVRIDAITPNGIVSATRTFTTRRATAKQGLQHGSPPDNKGTH